MTELKKSTILEFAKLLYRIKNPKDTSNIQIPKNCGDITIYMRKHQGDLYTKFKEYRYPKSAVKFLLDHHYTHGELFQNAHWNYGGWNFYLTYEEI